MLHLRAFEDPTRVSALINHKCLNFNIPFVHFNRENIALFAFNRPASRLGLRERNASDLLRSPKNVETKKKMPRNAEKFALLGTVEPSFNWSITLCSGNDI